MKYNKGGGENSGSIYWNDPSYLTRNILLTQDQITDLEDVRRPQKRSEIAQLAEDAKNQDADSRIFCYDGIYPDGDGTPACKNELGKAVVDIVNGAAYGCDDKETEPVAQINDYAGLGDPKESTRGKIYEDQWGNSLLLNLFGAGSNADVTHVVDGNYMDPQKAKTSDPWYEKIKSIWNISESTWPPRQRKTEANYYLVYPMGFELKEIETVIKNTFLTAEQIAEIEATEEILDGFPIQGAQMGISGGTASWDFPDPDKNCGTEATPSPCTEHVSIPIETENKGVGFLGANLGFWLRQVQRSLNSSLSATHNYITSCSTLEQFMLGQCAGGASIGNSTQSDFGYDTCGLKLGTGYCAPENLAPYFAEEGFANPQLEADKASRICQRESGSSPYAFNDRCVEGTSVDYSVGLFQINMLPRCPGSFSDGSGNPDTSAAYDPYNLPCTITDQVNLNECALSKLAIGSYAQPRINANLPAGATPIKRDTQTEEAIKAENNIKAMVILRKAWGNWQPWTAGAGNCSIE